MILPKVSKSKHNAMVASLTKRQKCVQPEVIQCFTVYCLLDSCSPLEQQLVETTPWFHNLLVDIFHHLGTSGDDQLIDRPIIPYPHRMGD